MNATSHLRPKHFRRPASREPRPCSGRPMKLDEGGAGFVSRVGHSRSQCRRIDRLDGHRTCANGSSPDSGPDVASLNLAADGLQTTTDQKGRALRVPQRMRADGLDRSLRGWNRSSPRFAIWRSGERERHNRLCKAGLNGQFGTRPRPPAPHARGSHATELGRPSPTDPHRRRVRSEENPPRAQRRLCPSAPTLYVRSLATTGAKRLNVQDV